MDLAQEVEHAEEEESPRVDVENGGCGWLVCNGPLSGIAGCGPVA
jgi:hypothetical protein